MTELMINSSFDLMTVTPDKVQALTEELLKMPQVDIPTEHIFEEGKYLRRITVPPHTVLTGAEHRNPYRVRLEKGTIVVTTEEGVKILTAPLEFDAPAGIQRAGHVLDEEVVWTDIYDNPDNCQNIEELENRYYVVPDIGLGSNWLPAEVAKVDYDLFLDDVGLTHAQVRSLVEIDTDLIPMPEEYCVELRPSEIDGTGLFANTDFEPGMILCPARLDGKRTPAGRYMNHSPRPNAIFERVGSDLWVTAITPIYPSQEVTVDYRQALSVNRELMFIRGDS